MEGTGTRWLVTLCLLTAAQCIPSRVTSHSETDSEDSRRVLGSSVVTSVSVIMDHGNGTKTYFADGQSKNVHKPTGTIIGSPGDLLSPDRYEFYTFDDTGDLVKRLMTLDEIHGLIAGVEPEPMMADDASPPYYHDTLASSHSSEALMRLPATDLESLDAPAVHKVLESVQNVLKNEMAANSGKPAPTMPPGVPSLHRPDSASAWSALFPGLIETPDDVAHLSGYLLPSKTAVESVAVTDKVQTQSFSRKPPTSTNKPSSSFVNTTTTNSSSSTTSTTANNNSSTMTERTKPGDKTRGPTTVKPSTTKKPFRPVQSFDKQKPASQRPAAADGPVINKEMSASITDMLSQVTDSRPSDYRPKPLQTNALVEKDNTADYVPEESSPELSYYSPMAMALSTAGAYKPVTEAFVSVKKPTTTGAYNNAAAQLVQKTTSSAVTPTTTATRFGPHRTNVTKPRPSGTNVTAMASYSNGNATKPLPVKYVNGSNAVRNNYHYPPSNMSTKYAQRTPSTTQTYPNKLFEHPVKVANGTADQATAPASANVTDETKNKLAAKEPPNKTFQTKITSARPSNVNRTNVTLSNRVQESKTTATTPSFGFTTTTVRSETTATTPGPDKFVSVKVEKWPGTTVNGQQQHPSTMAPYASTEKSFFSSTSNSGPSLHDAMTDANAIRDLLSSLTTKPTVPGISTTSTVTATATTTITATPTTAAADTSTAASSPSTVDFAQQTLTAAVSTTVPTVPVKTVTGTPVSSISYPIEILTTTDASTTTTIESTTTTTTTTTTAKTSAEATVSATTDASTTVATSSSVAVTSAAPESETQYVPVTHFLPELQVKDGPPNQNDNNYNGTPVQVDSMLKDGISAVTNMLQNTRKPSVVQDAIAYHQEIGERPYEKVPVVDGQQSSSTEPARKQATVKSEFKDATAEGVPFAQEPYEYTTVAAESTAKYAAEPSDATSAATAAELATTAETFSRVSEPGLEMLTVFNVSSTGGPAQQSAKLADLTAAETRVFYDTTTPLANDAIVSTIDPVLSTIGAEQPTATTVAAVSTPVTVPVTTTTSTATTTTTYPTTPVTITTSTATTAVAISSTVTTAAAVPEVARNATIAVATVPATAHPGPSSNAYRPLANNASPSTVELHPAPHESMGLEASVAFLGDDVRRFADLCNELSFKMWTAVTGKGQIASRSLVLSPFELTAMLAMVFLGARGSTSGQMNDVLRLDDMVTFNPHQVLRNITHSITNVNNPGVATASFVREIYSNKGNGKILEFYKERVQQYYDGHVEEVDFNTIGDVLRRRTNLLVKRQTLGRVVEYLRGSGLSLTPPFAAFSANVFQTSCESASTEGRDGEMYFVVRPSTRQRRLVPVPAAVWRGGFLAGYEPGLDATAVCLSPDSAVSTILVLPGQQGQVAPGDGLARLEQRLIETSYRRGGWSRILRSLLPRPGLELQVPRFSHRSVLNTTAALQKMGLKDVFSDQKADLRGVNGLYDLYLSDMLQVNTFSTCGEDAIGARHHVETYPASPQRMGRARTAPVDGGRRRRDTEDLPLHSPYSHLPLNMRPRQARLPDVPRLRFDRPFLYLVRHNPTGMIVYLGRFNPRLLP